ncbi:MAG: hypothetical protein ACKOFD_03380 [Actinomycetota bacterium]
MKIVVDSSASAEEAAAIVAAIEHLWPKPTVATGARNGNATSWRFSGRWWATSHVARRGRPTR